MREIRLTGKRRLVKVVTLDSMRVGQAKAKGIIVEVLLTDDETLGLRDGLLGMSYLNRFDSNIDLDNLKMTLTKKDKG